MVLKSQAAFEYMIIVAIVLSFIIPVWSYVSSVQTRSSIDLSLKYAKNAVERLTETIDAVYSQGPPAKVKLKLYIPKYVEKIEMINNTIIFRIRTPSGISDVFSTSIAIVNGSLPNEEGIYWVNVEAVGDIVQININK